MSFCHADSKEFDGHRWSVCLGLGPLCSPPILSAGSRTRDVDAGAVTAMRTDGPPEESARAKHGPTRCRPTHGADGARASLRGGEGGGRAEDANDAASEDETDEGSDLVHDADDAAQMEAAAASDQ